MYTTMSKVSMKSISEIQLTFLVVLRPTLCLNKSRAALVDKSPIPKITSGFRTILVRAIEKTPDPANIEISARAAKNGLLPAICHILINRKLPSAMAAIDIKIYLNALDRVIHLI